MAVAVLSILVGCATTRSSASKKYPPTSPDSVRIFWGTEKPTQPFEEIGRVSVDKFNAIAVPRSGDEIQRLMKMEAGKIGGDAIVAIAEDFASMSGVVIKFTRSTPPGR